MLLDYIDAAMKCAKYELLPSDGGFYASVPQCPGVWASGTTLEACHESLRSVLEEWIVVKLRHNDNDFASLHGISLNLRRSAPRKQRVA